jgi:indole-3-glycerol phosphate synthase
MVSVLTDARWFDGSPADLAAARAAVSIPVLCKDFPVDVAQVQRAWAGGADAALIIVRCLPDADALSQLIEGTRGYGLEPFVEVVDEGELERALRAGARVIGVNARDLDSLEMDTERAQRVLASIPADLVAVHLSGIRTGADAFNVAASRADAALIGEALMRRDNPAELLGELVRGASGKN